MIIAFDYDRVADNIKVQNLIKKLKRERNEIWIITMRRDNGYNANILKELEKIGISQASIIYCNGKKKIDMIEMVNADIYIDNISDEFDDIFNYTTAIPFLFNN
jgi:hypothetical protein